VSSQCFAQLNRDVASLSATGVNPDIDAGKISHRDRKMAGVLDEFLLARPRVGLARVDPGCDHVRRGDQQR
jgi:hypothetical protein